MRAVYIIQPRHQRWRCDGYPFFFFGPAGLTVEHLALDVEIADVFSKERKNLKPQTV